MGKGDKKTRKGKISQGSYGKKRTKKKSAVAIPVKVLDEKSKKVPKAEVEKKVVKPKATTKPEEEKPKTTRKKKTEE